MPETLPRRGLAWRAAATYGDCATAALLATIVSGVALAIPYEPADALASIATMQMANAAAAFARNIHYWSAQAFLLLSALHAWDHIRRRDPRRVPFAVWLRVCLTVPAIGLAAWTGFVLKGDTEAWQALRVVQSTLADVPLVGPLLATALVGRGESLSLVYLHHAATFTLFVWFVAVEHGRMLWPRFTSVLLVLAPVTLLSLWVSPALHDGLSAVIKGPWYFVGLQEVLHWSSRPGLVVLALTLPLIALLCLPWMGRTARRVTVSALLVSLVAYGALTIVAWGMRGANWAWTGRWQTPPATVVVSPLWRIPGPGDAPLRGRPLPVAMDRPEGCLACHDGVSGLGTSHDPVRIGCASCHGGNVFSLDAAAAHAGLLLVPGNLADAPRSCGGACHASIVPRVRASLMTTNAGIVATNRQAWGEAPAEAAPHITSLGFSPADSHLRQLCASCHLGVIKREPGPVTEESRGGGCNACHVAYSPEAARGLEQYRSAKAGGGAPDAPRVHPAIALPKDNTSCFGCHSRSGRISLSYDGWAELAPDAPRPTAGVRQLDDGRSAVMVSADAHAVKGMLCVDCHTAREVMGDGVRHARQLDQPHVACLDCHPVSAPAVVAAAEAGEEARRVARLRALPTGSRPLMISTAGDAFVNAFVEQDGRARLARKRDGGLLELRAPRPECRDAVHRRVACITCHSAWAPRCPTCHTRFDAAREGFDALAERAVSGEWMESGGGFAAVPPTLGTRRVAGAVAIEPFVPGMIATLDGRGVPGGAPSPMFRRWYARSFAHTVTRRGRACVSCHGDPVALGFGEGRLEFVATEAGRGRWQLAPAHPSLADGLPADAWVGFLGARSADVSARDDVRPLSVEEQRAVLDVGACLTCHAAESVVMRESLRGFAAVVKRMTPACRRASW